MDNGIAALDSHLPGSSVRLIQHEGKIKKRGYIQLLVMNSGEAPVNVGPENVLASLADGTAVAIIPYERLLKEEKNRQMWAAIATGLAAASNSMSAANAGYSSGTITSNYGFATYSGYNSGQAFAAQAIANQQNQQLFDGLAARKALGKEALSVNMRTSTVDPNDMFDGTITFELPKEARSSKVDVPVTFLIKIGSDEHRIEALLKKR